jgi:hypothetical protein
MRKRRKRSPKVQRHPISRPELESKKLVWDFSRIDVGGKWGWNSMRILRNIWSKMNQFQTMTWNDILGSSHHAIAVDKIIKPAQKRLQELKYDDVDELVSFHLNGKKRLWAIQRGNSAYVLWWDPRHEIYPVRKKRT